MARKPTDIINLKLRLPEALRRKLEKAAEQSDRSMNSEIIRRLEQSFLKEAREAELKQLARDIVREMAGPTTLADIGKPRKPEGEDKS